MGGVSINKFVFMQVIVSFQKMPKARRKCAAATSTEGRGRGSRGRGRGRGRQEQVDVIEDVPPTIVQPQSVGQPQTTSEAGRSLDNVSSVNIINGNIPSTSTSSSINDRQGQSSPSEGGGGAGSQSVQDVQLATGASNVVGDNVQGSQQIPVTFGAPGTSSLPNHSSMGPGVADQGSLNVAAQREVIPSPASTRNQVVVPDIVGLGASAGGMDFQSSLHRPNSRQLGAPLGQYVSQTIKEKIWSWNFVDLGCLLTSEMSDNSDVTLSLCHIGGQICFKQNKPRTRPIFTIDLWTQAFFIYVSIFLERHASKAIEMIRYVDLIRKLAHRFNGKGWIQYDKEFRMGQAVNPQRSWGSYDADLFMDKITATHSVSPQFFRGQGAALSRQQGASFSRPTGSSSGVCFTFQKGRCLYGRSCRFQHSCELCSKSGHGAEYCRNPGFKGSKANIATQKGGEGSTMPKPVQSSQRVSTYKGPNSN